MIHVVDTHAVIWFVERSKGLGKAARAILIDPDSTLIVPTIVLAEIRYIAASRRISPSYDDVLQVIRSDSRFTQMGLDETIVGLMPLDLDIHDAIVVATTLLFTTVLNEEAAVITKDEAIVDAGIVNTVW